MKRENQQPPAFRVRLGAIESDGTIVLHMLDGRIVAGASTGRTKTLARLYDIQLEAMMERRTR